MTNKTNILRNINKPELLNLKKELVYGYLALIIWVAGISAGNLIEKAAYAIQTSGFDIPWLFMIYLPTIADILPIVAVCIYLGRKHHTMNILLGVSASASLILTVLSMIILALASHFIIAYYTDLRPVYEMLRIGSFQ